MNNLLVKLNTESSPKSSVQKKKKCLQLNVSLNCFLISFLVIICVPLFLNMYLSLKHLVIEQTGHIKWKSNKIKGAQINVTWKANRKNKKLLTLYKFYKKALDTIMEIKNKMDYTRVNNIRYWIHVISNDSCKKAPNTKQHDPYKMI